MVNKKLDAIITELSAVLRSVDSAAVDKAVGYITKAPKIFVAGAGRSGYMMRAFAMRLMHGGVSSFVVGDTETPGAFEGDLLILGSGSGETESLIVYARKAKKLGLNVIVVTGFPDSALGKLADTVIQISAPTPKSEKKSEIISVQPMGSLFEQALLLCMDAIVMEVMEAKGLNSDIMFRRHANLE